MTSQSSVNIERLALLVIGLGFAGLLFPGSDGPSFAPFDRLCDAIHIPLFALLAIAFHFIVTAKVTHGTQSWAITTTVTLLTIVGIELIQPLVGRSASMTDVYNGIIGATIGLASLRLYSKAIPVPQLFAASLLAAVGVAWALHPAWDEWQTYQWQKQSFPVLADFNEARAIKLWQPYAWGADTPVSTNRVAVAGSTNKYSLELTLPSAKWAGVEYRANQLNWAAYDELYIELYNHKQSPITLSVRIDDAGASASYYSRFTTQRIVKPGRNTLRIPFSDIAAFPFERSFDLHNIVYLRLYTSQASLPTRLQIDSVQLRKKQKTTKVPLPSNLSGNTN